MTLRAAVEYIALHLDIELAADWRGIGAVWPILERMRADGAIVLVKLDGQRMGSGARPYTLLVSGEPLGGDTIRLDHRDLDEGLCRMIIDYALRVWGISPVDLEG